MVSTPLTGAKDRVKVWLRVSQAECPHDSPEDRNIVVVDGNSTIKIGTKAQQADGVIPANQQVVASVGSELISDLVEHTNQKPSFKTAVLLCYGEEVAGRDQVLAFAPRARRPFRGIRHAHELCAPARACW